MRTSRHAPPPGAPSARSAARPRLALAALLGLLCACGHDDADPVAATADRNPPSRDVAPPPRGPLATYRLATTRSADGETLTIEALAPCRITLEVEQGASREGTRARDLEPGDAIRVAWSVTRVDGTPRGADPGAGSVPGELAHRLRYSLDDADAREALVRIRATSPAPWVRTATATLPVSPRPFPADGIALAAVGVADLAAHAGLAFVLEPAPSITGAPDGTPASSLHTAVLWLRIAPR